MSDRFRLFGQKLIASNPWYLAPLSMLYALAVYIRNHLYDLKWFKVSKVRCTVVSVGNIVAGGTGKTPFVQMLLSHFKHRKVAVLSRGYGNVADEALIHAKTCSVFVGKNRAKLAETIAKDFDLLILDDGFQHRKLHRDFDIVLTRKNKEHYLPWGFLRDSPKRLKGATVFQEDELEWKVSQILDLSGKAIPTLQGCKAILFCGIARPDRFRKTVEALGVEVIGQKIFADHSAIDLNQLPEGPLYICTEKDAVKIGPTDLTIYYLKIEMQIVQGLTKWEKLIEKIDQKIDNHKTL